MMLPRSSACTIPLFEIGSSPKATATADMIPPMVPTVLTTSQGIPLTTPQASLILPQSPTSLLPSHAATLSS